MPISNSARLTGAAAFALLTGISTSATAQDTETAPTAEDAQVTTGETTTGEGSAQPAVQERRTRGGGAAEQDAKAREIRQSREVLNRYGVLWPWLHDD